MLPSLWEPSGLVLGEEFGKAGRLLVANFLSGWFSTIGVGRPIALRRGDCPILRLALCVIKLRRLFIISWLVVYSLVNYGLESSNTWVSVLYRQNLQHLVSLNGGGRQYRQCPRRNGRVSTP